MKKDLIKINGKDPREGIVKSYFETLPRKFRAKIGHITLLELKEYAKQIGLKNTNKSKIKLIEYIARSDEFRDQVYLTEYDLDLHPWLEDIREDFD